MKNETLKQIIKQIKKYDLIKVFKEPEQFNNWCKGLNKTQINNFLSLDIDSSQISFPLEILINNDLLNCKDCNEKLYALSKLKNSDGYLHLFNILCNPIFLNSKNFYKDIEMISKADNIRYALCILDKKDFINSPYHDEDLKLIVETHDISKDNPLDFVISDSLTTVASNIDSINSPYHQADMKLISQTEAKNLQLNHSYPERSITYLAMNKTSLKDKYHLENMKILANNPSEFLYNIMTNQNIIDGKNYRKEVYALVNAKSKHTARALYYYIANPRNKFNKDFDFCSDYSVDSNVPIIYNKCVNSNSDPNYIENLAIINQIKDEFVMHYVSLLMNLSFINSPYKQYDLNLLKQISNKNIFMDLYKLMTDEDSLNGIHHKNDALIISKTNDDNLRSLLLCKACNQYSIKSPNHEYDMNYIQKLNLDSIDENIYKSMYYYLFNASGMDDIKHTYILENLYNGIIIKENNSFIIYLDSLEKQIIEDNKNQIIESISDNEPKGKSKILSLFKKTRKINKVF